MCGIAGVINRKKTVNVGEQMRLMLQGLKHRGPDSTGYAMYGTPKKKGFVMRFKISENEAEKVKAVIDSPEQLKERKSQVDAIMKKHGAKEPNKAPAPHTLFDMNLISKAILLI